MKLTPRRYLLVVLAAATVWLAVAVAALFVGAESLGRFDGEVFWEVLASRGETVLMAALVGAALAASGVAFQALLRNPLAEPYVLGISGGASLGVILSTLLLPASLRAIEVVLPGGMAMVFSLTGVCGFVMALVTIAVVYGIAQRHGRLDPYRLILTGVVVNAFFGAAIMLTTALAGDQLRNQIIFWLMGGLGGLSIRWGEMAVASVIIVAGLLVFAGQAKGFNLMTFGEDTAATLGLNVRRHRRVAFVVASLLAGVSVSLAGPIGFVGLIVPHILRMIFGPDHRLLVPLSIFGGAIFLTVADRLVQLVPYEIAGALPVGVVTALCGVPFFILLLRRSGRIPGGGL